MSDTHKDALLQKVTKKSGGKGKKGRKVGRDRKKCQEYRARGLRIKNKIRKLRKHIKRQPNDEAALEVLKRLAG